MRQHAEQSWSIRNHLTYFFAAIILASCTNEKSANQMPGEKESISALIPPDSTTPVLPGNYKASEPTTSNKSPSDTATTTITSPDDFLQKATVSRQDSLIWLQADMKRDHKIIGYHQPDTLSRKMLLLSIFTSDVEKNPFNCPLGAYYDTSGMRDMRLKYLATEGNFITVAVSKNNKYQDTIYIARKWVVFE